MRWIILYYIFVANTQQSENLSLFKNPYGGKSKENLELMDDAVYIKRHEKPEALEKRTKKLVFLILN